MSVQERPFGKRFVPANLPKASNAWLSPRCDGEKSSG
jgi:hypothetical protein